MSRRRSGQGPYAWRRRLAMTVVLLVAAGLGLRAAQLQLGEGALLRQHGDARYLRTVTVPAHRGIIRDRFGEPLAISTPVSSVWADPRKLVAARERWPALAARLGIGVDHLRAIVEPRAEREFVYLRRHVDPQRAAAVRALHVPGVGLRKEYRRYYPTAEVTAHALGFTNVDDRGQEGLELAFDARLAGRPGARRMIRDRLGHIIEDVETVREAVPGEDLTITLDRRLQYLAYRELKAAVARHHARAGSIVIVDAPSGEILALANQPSFNPNNRRGLTGERYRNRAVTDLFEPGSTVKPFAIAAALEAGVVRPDTVIDTRPGRLEIGGYTIRDAGSHGRLSVTDVIARSSNVGAAKIALALDPARLVAGLAAAGFGESTWSGFPGEASGVLPDPHGWSEVRHATIAFGYGLSATLLQLARAYAVIANDGVRRPLTIVPASEPAAGARAFRASTMRTVRAMLEAAVTRGTGQRARIPGYRVAGKTGTVRKVTPRGYAEDRYVALFAGLVPASRPRLVVVALVDEPRTGGYYGGEVAAPLFARVTAAALRLLNVAPDAQGAPAMVRLARSDRVAGAP